MEIGGRDIAIACATISPSTFIQDLTKERMTKKAITYVSMAIQRVALPQQELLDFVLTALKKPDPNDPSNFGDVEIRPKRFATALVLASLLCYLLPSPPQDWADKVIDIMKENDEITPLICSTRFVSIASSKTPKTVDRVTYAKTQLFIKSASKSIEMYYIYNALYAMEPKSKMMDKLYESGYQYIQSNLPSLFSCGLKILNMSISKATKDSEIDYILKHSLTTTIQRFTLFLKLSNIPENFVLYLSNIMNRSTLSKHHATILKNFDIMMPFPNSASFAAMSVLLPKMVVIAEANNDVLKKIASFSSSLFTKPGSLFLCKVNISITREESQRNKLDPKNSGSDTIILDRVTEFLSNSKTLDGPSIIDIILEYIIFLTQTLGMNDGLQFVVLQFHKYIPRFYPLFIAFAKFLKKSQLLDIIQKPKEENSEDEYIFSLISMFSSVLQNKCHSTAVSLLTDKSQLKLAMKLASFDSDCDESNKLLPSQA